MMQIWLGCIIVTKTDTNEREISSYLVEAYDTTMDDGFPDTLSKGHVSAFLEVSVTNCSNERLATRTIGQIVNNKRQ